jgi:hypothetical protein
MARTGLIFTPTAVETIRGLADQGKSAPEIASAIGSTPGSVRVKCCQLKIKLPRRGRPPILLHSLDRQNGGRKLVVHMSSSDYASLKWKAAYLKKSSDELATKLLEAIINSNIYEAVLDEDE